MKGAYQSTNSVKFHVSCRKFEIFHFDGFFLSKPYKVSAKKVQNSYLSRYQSVMQSLNKNWLVVSNDMGILVNFYLTTEKSETFTSMGSFCPKYISFELKNIQKSYFLMTLNSDAKIE